MLVTNILIKMTFGIFFICFGFSDKNLLMRIKSCAYFHSQHYEVLYTLCALVMHSHILCSYITITYTLIVYILVHRMCMLST